MVGQPAFVVMEYELEHMLRTTAREAAQEVIAAFRSELSVDPTDAVVRRLRGYLEDRSSVANPRDQWANGLHIRLLKPGPGGKARSTSWLQQFKVRSGLCACISRKSLSVGGTREWCFEDIANAWERLWV